MTQWDKLLQRICSLDVNIRFDEVRKVLEGYGYKMTQPKKGSSHYVFRKQGCSPITIPKHSPIKKTYVKLVRNVINKESGEGE